MQRETQQGMEQIRRRAGVPLADVAEAGEQTINEAGDSFAGLERGAGFRNQHEGEWKGTGFEARLGDLNLLRETGADWGCTNVSGRVSVCVCTHTCLDRCVLKFACFFLCCVCRGM